MKLPLWVQVKVERFLDEQLPGSITLHTDGMKIRQVERKMIEREPPEGKPGMQEYG